ncbi:H-NS family nucleoid-associated regulatory protein [Paraburkholderia sp. J12]|uniref:H-NS family nucleoid-associated regulatory protein n=1 Tax=Paraburkholderia sp. J12 TaxID=2805432 RepID=UPI002ABDDF2F|nr:H-NS family nucleoid-associated regulatory protein [Paraburkholderia sp. J12]
MPTYLELLAQKRALDARIEEARAEAAAEALAAARAAIAEFGFTPEDLFGKSAKKAGVGAKVAGRGARKPRAAEASEGRAGGETLDLFAPADKVR